MSNPDVCVGDRGWEVKFLAQDRLMVLAFHLSSLVVS